METKAPEICWVSKVIYFFSVTWHWNGSELVLAAQGKLFRLRCKLICLVRYSWWYIYLNACSLIQLEANLKESPWSHLIPCHFILVQTSQWWIERLSLFGSLALWSGTRESQIVTRANICQILKEAFDESPSTFYLVEECHMPRKQLNTSAEFTKVASCVW